MKKLFLLLVFLTSFQFIIAQEKLNLDLNKCIELAMEKNNSLNQIKLDYARAKEQVRETYGTSVFPNVNGNVNYSYAVKRPEFFLETPFFSGSFPAGTKNNLTASVNINQPLFTGALFLAVRIANTFAEISEKQLKYSKSELTMKVKEAYYTRLLANSLVDLADLQVSRAKENVNNAKTMYDAGLIAEYDYIRANVELQNLLPLQTGAINQVKLSGNNLKFIIGIPLDTEVVIDDSLFYESKESVDFEEGYNWMLKKNFLLKQSELDVEIKDLTAKYQWSKHLPELNGFGNWQTQAQENEREFFNWRYKNSFSIGLSLKVPIFEGFATDSRVQQAKIDLKRSEEGLSQVKKNLRNDYENTQLEIKRIKQQIDAYKESVEQTEYGYEIAQKRFNSGLSSQIEVTDAMLNFTSAKVNYLKSIHEYYLQEAKLSFLLGKLK